MTMTLKLAFAITILLTISFNQIVSGDIGTATSYNPPYTRESAIFVTLIWYTYIPKYCCAATRCNGNRADQFPSGNLFVQVSEGLWDNGAACGRRYRLRCLSGNNRPCKGGTVDVRVVDFCTRRPCPSTIVMSTDAFAAVSKSPDAKINIEFIQ
ncbi:hypothetical protein SASPL_157253 [Salvia splendens]|uniref:Expansin-like EG45 domain-containing protein n=1 Tax=Salvia splendens TaxID=180675 RepID=A0A8X8YVS2_SALSN|nr:hypothetical protein SASPL_157253 [Salvia splendens]